MLTECFEVLGGVPKVVLADRMGCPPRPVDQVWRELGLEVPPR